MTPEEHQDDGETRGHTAAWVVGTIVLLMIAGIALAVRANMHQDQRRRVEMARFSFRIGGDREAERAYMEACRECAPAAECERDRLVISLGRATDSYNPCD